MSADSGYDGEPSGTIAGAGPRARDVDAASRASGWLAAATLCQRELVRFLRQRNRVIGALGQPLLFWVLFGAGLRSSFHPPGADPNLTYAEYFLPGVLVLIVFFTAIFSTISVIEDRREGFLQGVLVAPVPRSMVVLGKVMGGTALAMLQAWIFMGIAVVSGMPLGAGSVLGASMLLLVAAVGLTGLGMCLAWRMDSTQGFHAIMSVFLMPMWLLSGAFFPARGAPTWLAWVIHCNPLTYVVAGLRRVLWWGREESLDWAQLPGLQACLVVSIVFSGAMFCLAVRIAGSRSGG